MVRTIDAVARRRELAEAVWRIAERDGLDAASVRSVAQESGLSAGSVRHFFGTQHELLTFAMQELIAVVGERIRAAGTTVDVEDRAVAMLGELMPLTATSRAEAVVHLQFVQRARLDPELQVLATASFEAILGVCRDAVRRLVDAGRLPEDTPVAATGRMLWAVVDGLTLQLLFAPDLVSPTQARRTLRHAIRQAGTR